MLGFWCPGCENMHAVKIEGEGSWAWNGDVDRPTFSPSVRCFTTFDENYNLLPNGAQRTLCHLFVKLGQIEFLGDCVHSLAGNTVVMPDLPDWLRD